MKAYLEANKERFLEELFELLRIPSISTDPSHAPDLLKAANYVKEKLLEAGVDKAEICQTKALHAQFLYLLFPPYTPSLRRKKVLRSDRMSVHDAPCWRR